MPESFFFLARALACSEIELTPVSCSPGDVSRHIAEWNPFSATVQACRELFGNLPPGFKASDAWPMQHPVWASLIWSVVIILFFRTLAVRKYRRASG